MNIAAVILAAGKGTRMNSSLPKVLHKIAGLPILGHVLNLTDTLKIEKPVIVTGHEAQLVENYVNLKNKNAVIAHQKHQLGTGNALQCAARYLAKHKQNLIVLSGDVPFIQKNTILSMLNQIDEGSDLAVLGFQTNSPKNYGRLILGKDNLVDEIVEEKDATDVQKEIKLCNAGIYCGPSEVMFSLVSKIKNQNVGNEFYLTDIIKIAKEGDLKTSLVVTDLRETQGINSRSNLASAERYYQDHLRQKALDKGVTLIDPKTIYFSHDTLIGQDTIVQPNVIFGPLVQIGAKAEIFSFSHLEGCVIAPGSRIGPFARIRPGTMIEEDVKVGNFVEIKKSTLKKGSKANHLSYIGDATIGRDTNIGAGTVFCNYDGVFKHSIEIGDRAFVGSNSSLVAPLQIGSDTLVGSGSVITANVPQSALAISRPTQKNKKKLGKRIMEKLKSLKK